MNDKLKVSLISAPFVAAALVVGTVAAVNGTDEPVKAPTPSVSPTPSTSIPVGPEPTLSVPTPKGDAPSKKPTKKPATPKTKTPESTFTPLPTATLPPMSGDECSTPGAITQGPQQEIYRCDEGVWRRAE